MTFRSAHCGHDEESAEPHKLWTWLQKQHALPPVLSMRSALPCWRCAGDRAGGAITAWLELLGSYGGVGLDKRGLTTEMAWIVAYSEWHSALPETEANLTSLGVECHLLGAAGANLITAAGAIYGVTSLFHTALLRGLKYWAFRAAQMSARAKYLNMLDLDISTLSCVIEEHDRLLALGEGEPTFRIPLYELNRLYFTLADVYESIGQIAAFVAPRTGSSIRAASPT